MGKFGIMSIIRSGRTKTTCISLESISQDTISLMLSSANVITLTNGTVQIEKELIVPTGNTLQRPSVPIAGEIRFNTSLGIFEGYNGTEWGTLQA